MIEMIENTINNIDILIKEQLPESKYQFELFDLKTNTKHFRGYDEPFHWGSVYKLFVVAEIIKMSEEGLFQMDDEIELHKELYQNGNGIIKNFTHLSKITYQDACTLVMTTSDNICADNLLKIVSLERLNILFNNLVSNSKLSLNLNDLVGFLFNETPKGLLSNYYHSKEYFDYFKKKLNDLLVQNYTNVKDINHIFYFITHEYFTSEISKKTFMSCVLSNNLHSRVIPYTYFSKFMLKGKTGTLAFGISQSETVAVVDKNDNKIRSFFSLNTNYNTQRYFQLNDIFGLIGLEIVKLYEQLNIDN